MGKFIGIGTLIFLLATVCEWRREDSITPPDVPPVGCTSDADCEVGLICVEGECVSSISLEQASAAYIAIMSGVYIITHFAEKFAYVVQEVPRGTIKPTEKCKLGGLIENKLSEGEGGALVYNQIFSNCTHGDYQSTTTKMNGEVKMEILGKGKQANVDVKTNLSIEQRSGGKQSGHGFRDIHVELTAFFSKPVSYVSSITGAFFSYSESSTRNIQYKGISVDVTVIGEGGKEKMSFEVDGWADVQMQGQEYGQKCSGGSFNYQTLEPVILGEGCPSSGKIRVNNVTFEFLGDNMATLDDGKMRIEKPCEEMFELCQ
jgi:hypothetical protein